MLRRPALIACLALALPGWAARPRLAVVKSAELAPYAQVVAGFTAEARGAVDDYTLEEGPDGAARTLQKVAASSPALVLAVGPAAAVAARKQFTEVPVLFAMVPYFQKYELEGPNTTGIALTSDLSFEFDAIKATLPRARRVGVVADPRYSAKLLEDAAGLAKARGLTLVPLEVDGAAALEKVLASAASKIDVLVLVTDKTVGHAGVVERLIAFCQEARLPSVAVAPSQVKQGALLALAPSPLGIGLQAGRIANRVLVEKVDPGALAVAQPEGVEVHVNLSTARRLGNPEAFVMDLVGFAGKRGLALKAQE